MQKINEANATELTGVQGSRKSAAYSSPRLVAYGCVRALTNSGVGSVAENMGNDTKPNKRS